MSDDDLVVACRAGDPAAWAEVVRRYQALVRSIPRAYGLRGDDIAEVTQLTFSILVQSLDRLRPGTTLAPWLSTVARRHTWRLLEARRREAATELTETSLTHDAVRVHGERHADAEWLQAAMRELPPRCRSLLEALYLRGEAAYTEISAELGIPIGSIGPTRSRCLEKLRAALVATAPGDGET